MKDYILKNPGRASAHQCSYVDYLLKRLTDYRKAGGGYGQRFRAPITFAVTKRIATNQLGVDLHSAAHFDQVCAHLQEKIDATILGKRNASRGVRNYHSLEEHGEE